MSGFVNPSAPPHTGGSDLPYPTHPPQASYPSPGGYPPAPYGQSQYPPAPSQSPYPPPQQAYPPHQDAYPQPSYGSNIPYPCAPPTGYPSNDIPYPPSTNPTYPPNNAPYPANNGPYPQNQPSYPPTNAPYPPPDASYPPPSPDAGYHQERSGHSNVKEGALGAAGAAGAALLSGVKSLAGGKKHHHNNGGYGGHQEYYDDRGHHHSKDHKSDKMDNVLHMGQQVMQSGLLGRKAQMAGAAMHVANTDTSSKSGGILGTAAASGLMGHKGRMAAHAAGLGQSKGEGGPYFLFILFY